MTARGRPRKKQRTLDQGNYMNWGATRLGAALSEHGIATAANFPLAILRKLYVDNVTNATQATMNPDTVTGLDIPALPRTRSRLTDTGSTAAHYAYAAPPADVTVTTTAAAHTTQTPCPRAAPPRVSAETRPATPHDVTPPPAPRATTTRGLVDILSVTPAVGGASNIDPVMDGAAPIIAMLTKTVTAFESALAVVAGRADRKETPTYNLEAYYSQRAGHAISPAQPQPSTSIANEHGVAPDNAPRIETVTAGLRQRIVQGKNINLASLLIPLFDPSKDDERKLTQHMSFVNFLRAFARYKRIMCEAYPNRRIELEGYEMIVQDIYALHGDRYYEYHKLFAQKSATALENNKIKLDWSQRDSGIYSLISSHAGANQCLRCGEFNHATEFCPAYTQPRATVSSLRAAADADHQAAHRSDVSQAICRFFQRSPGCQRNNCVYRHVCDICLKSGHGSTICPTQAQSKQAPMTPKVSTRSRDHRK